LLRRYRIDELPQLINVLRGEMSLVGPRPEPWDVAESLGREIPRYHDRHLVRPGLTGLCQLSPDYLDFGTVQKSAKKLQHDLEYVDNPSFVRDFAILWRSLRVIFQGAGVA
jgi:lipopolysaccharide/colanic/teichoic acid biosynthesis glycosyltransferase